MSLQLSSNVSKALAEAVEKDVSRRAPLFAVVHLAGKQYKVTTNDVIQTHLLHCDVGSKIKLEKVQHRYAAKRCPLTLR